MKLTLFVMIYMFYTLAWYDTVYLFDECYIHWLYSACIHLFEYKK